MPTRSPPIRAALRRAASTANRMRLAIEPPQASVRWLDAVLRN
jgi:hypothetical protein